jgi:hypothetical protein
MYNCTEVCVSPRDYPELVAKEKSQVSPGINPQLSRSLSHKPVPKLTVLRGLKRDMSKTRPLLKVKIYSMLLGVDIPTYGNYLTIVIRITLRRIIWK